ncbi:hypothetical protein AAVH_31999, partial [Aphelenchoides avenae]
NVPDVSERLANCQLCSAAMRAEYLVLCEFLMSSGVLDFVEGDKKQACQSLSTSFLYTWQLYESAMCTIRSFGHHQRRLFCLNESYVDLDEGAIEVFYRKDPSVYDANYAMRHGMEFYVSFMDMIKKLAKARLDDVEHAVLTLILLVERARKLASNPDKFPFASLVNDVFRELHKHYEENYEDTALRLDELVQLALEIQ